MTETNLKTYFAGFTLNNSERQNTKTEINHSYYGKIKVPRYINEFWTSKQRQSNSIHEISYRACYKAELPRFFITLFSKPGDIIYDPFAGRGTTNIEAALLNRNIIANDINPLSAILSKPRLFVPSFEDVKKRLNEIKFKDKLKADVDLSMFYHQATESEIVSLRNYLIRKKRTGTEDFIDEWIRMIATNRLTGHSKNFFSVYTLPPNQAVTQERQKRINKLRKQVPAYKDVRFIILKKTRDLTATLNKKLIDRLKLVGSKAKFLNDDARFTSGINNDSVRLTVTSPPFLDIVNYVEDNWLRCWFNNINVNKVAQNISITKEIVEWERVMGEVFIELYRITKKRGYVAFEVGEVRKGKINLDEHVIPLGIASGFECLGVVINLQKFTKTANIWGVSNNAAGTNTNRIVIFRKK